MLYSSKHRVWIPHLDEVLLLLIVLTVKSCLGPAFWVSFRCKPDIVGLLFFWRKLLNQEMKDSEAKHLQVIPSTLILSFMSPGWCEGKWPLEWLIYKKLNVSICFFIKDSCHKSKICKVDLAFLHSKVFCLYIPMNVFNTMQFFDGVKHLNGQSLHFFEVLSVVILERF